MEIKPDIETFANIKVVGVGGSGGSAINRMVTAGLKGIEMIAVNTDAQALHHNKAEKKLHIGKETTRGLGAGMDPELGLKSAEESRDDLLKMLQGSDMVFLTCGLGGGTGTGATPVIADVAKELGALTVAIVTKPFAFEGEQRRAIAENGYGELSSRVDTIITIPNDRLLQIIDKKTSLLESFSIVDDVLRQGVQGISEIITTPGLINVDFADVKAVMENTGSALMGIGRASGENRAIDAAKSAIDSPLLEMSIEGAKGILFTIRGGENLSMFEVNEAAKVITETADANAKIIFGTILDNEMKDELSITVVATGFGQEGKAAKRITRTVATENAFAGRPMRERERNIEDQLPPIMSQPFTREREATNHGPAERRLRQDIERAPTVKDEEEDLEIPAFIRKKMM